MKNFLNELDAADVTEWLFSLGLFATITIIMVVVLITDAWEKVETAKARPPCHCPFNQPNNFELATNSNGVIYIAIPKDDR